MGLNKKLFIQPDAAAAGDGHLVSDQVALFEFGIDDGTYTGSGEKTSDTGSGKFGGQSAHFNGSSSKIIANIPQPTGDRTVSCWVRFHSIPSAQKEFLDWVGNSSVPTIRFNTYDSDDLRIASGGERYISNGSHTIEVGEWYHIAVSISGSTATPYFNNNALSTFTSSGSTTDTQNLHLGHNLDENRFSACQIDEVRLYDAALSSSEIDALYTNTSPRTSNLIAYYKMNGNSDDEQTTYNGTDTNMTYGYRGEVFDGGSGTVLTTSTPKFGTHTALFDGSDDDIDLPAFNIGVNDFSYGMWYKADDITTANQILIIMVQAADHLNYGIQLNQISGKISVHPIASGGGTKYLYSSGVTLDYNWHHVMYTKSSTDGHVLYHDGTAVASDATFTGDLATSSGSNRLGRSTSNIQEYAGRIDQLRFFNRALTSAEVSTLYNES